MLTLDLGDMLRQHYRRLGDLVDAIDASVTAQDWPQCVARAVVLNDLLRKHIRFEEDELLPAVLDDVAAQDRPAAHVERMHAEHVGVSNLATLLAVSSPAHDPEGWRGILAELREQLERHMEDEFALIAERSAALSADVVDQFRRRSAALVPIPRVGRFLDVSGMEPPGPMFRILDELPRADTPLTVRIHREPVPLYGVLQEGGYAHRTTVTDDGHFEILIWRAEKPRAGGSGNA